MARTVLGAWQAEGELVRVIDGDTVEADFDLGWYTWRRIKVRIKNIDAPEMDTPPGVAARDHLVELLPVGCRVVVTSHALDKYGRTLGTLMFADGARVTADVGAVMARDGYATARPAQEG